MPELDLMTDHQAVASLEAEFPGWMIFRQGKGVWLRSCFAKRHSDSHQVEGEDWADLRDALIGHLWRSAE